MARPERLSAMDHPEVVKKTEVSAFQLQIKHLLIHLSDELIQRGARFFILGSNGHEIRVGPDVRPLGVSEQNRHRVRVNPPFINIFKLRRLVLGVVLRQMGFIRANAEPLLEEDGLYRVRQVERVDISDRRGGRVWISQAREGYEVPAERVESVLCVPGQKGLAARSERLVLMAPDRQDVVYEPAVLLSCPAERIAEQGAEEYEQQLLPPRGGRDRAVAPMRGRGAEAFLIDRKTRDAKDARQLPETEFVECETQPGRQSMRIYHGPVQIHAGFKIVKCYINFIQQRGQLFQLRRVEFQRIHVAPHWLSDRVHLYNCGPGAS
jgi:hypothetical protein